MSGTTAGTPVSARHVPVARVVVEVEPFHLDRPFDYLVPDGVQVVAGQRVQVGFSGRLVRGLVVEVVAGSELPATQLKPLRRVLGDHVWVPSEELEVLRWAAARFAAPLADVVRHALPARVVDVERRAAKAGWYPPGSAPRPPAGSAPDSDAVEAAWSVYGVAGAQLRAALEAGSGGSFLWRPVPGEDLAARLAELVETTLAADRDVLFIVPDAASPVADRIANAAGDLAVDLRGGPSARTAYRGWLEARCGRVRVVVGERGAVFTPLRRLGLAVVLDEANPALKERRSPRHHAREVALERARRAGAVGLLVGVVPSARAWELLRDRRLRPVVAARDREVETRPRVRVVTMEDQPRARLARESTAALRRAVRAGAYGVVLAGRRGEGRALVCTGCGERLTCPRCSASLARIEDAPAGVFCIGCGWSATRWRGCARCGGVETVPLAAGAARLGAELARSMKVEVAVLEGYARRPPPAPAVLVMTRGSVLDAPPGDVRAVILPDIDGALRRPTLDAAEDALRLACLVASWTVGGSRPAADAEVVVQTREPDHHAIVALKSWDPGGFWRREVELRRPLRFPPVTPAVRLEVAPGETTTTDALRRVLPPDDELLGPIPADGREGYLVKSGDRLATLTALRELRVSWSRAGREVRVDVDPVDAL